MHKVAASAVVLLALSRGSNSSVPAQMDTRAGSEERCCQKSQIFNIQYPTCVCQCSCSYTESHAAGLNRKVWVVQEVLAVGSEITPKDKAVM